MCIRDRLDTIVPADPNVPYDMKDIIERVVDNGYFFEVMTNFAKNIIIGLDVYKRQVVDGGLTIHNPTVELS